MGIVGVFLISHILRVALNLHEMLVIEQAMECGKAGLRSFPVWALMMGSISHLLLVFNSSINIVIYCSLNVTFRQHFWDIIKLLPGGNRFIACCQSCNRCQKAGSGAGGDGGEEGNGGATAAAAAAAGDDGVTATTHLGSNVNAVTAANTAANGGSNGNGSGGSLGVGVQDSASASVSTTATTASTVVGGAGANGNNSTEQQQQQQEEVKVVVSSNGKPLVSSMKKVANTIVVPLHYIRNVPSGV